VAGLVAIVASHQVWIGGILTFFGVMSFLTIQLPSSDQAEKNGFQKGHEYRKVQSKGRGDRGIEWSYPQFRQVIGPLSGQSRDICPTCLYIRKFKRHQYEIALRSL